VVENEVVNVDGVSLTAFEAVRGRLFALAYRMLGSRALSDESMPGTGRDLREFVGLETRLCDTGPLSTPALGLL
jgi:hypothetical protein